MDWVSFEIKHRSILSEQFPPPAPQISSNGDFSLNNKVSPSILLIIIILAIIFFVSGLLHLLVRFLLRHPNRDPDDDSGSVTAREGQLQQLFHLHDAGVDQSFIDTLPVFNYKSIIGVKNPFDCAVCLCEFESEDKLRLLPKCSHAFHMDCIDTWLLSHSTCPLCRASLLPDFSPNRACSPIVLVLESGSDSSREIISATTGAATTITTTSQYIPTEVGSGDDQSGSFRRKSCEIVSKNDSGQGEDKVVHVKLGKFRNVDNTGTGAGTGSGTGTGEGSSENKSVDARRCFSMGSFQYVMDETTSLQVPIRTPIKKQPSKKPNLPLTPGHRAARSECDCESRRDFTSFEPFKRVESDSGSAIVRSRRESFSVSKIWLREKKDNKNNSTAGESSSSSSRRAFSFRFPLHKDVVDDSKTTKYGEDGTRRANSEIDMVRRGSSELGCDDEIQSSNSLESQANPPSFARRTLLWLVGRQNKVVHSSFQSCV